MTIEPNNRTAASAFDSIKETDVDGAEVWRARRLQEVMTYPRWADFMPVIDRAMEAVENTGSDVEENFRPTPEVSGKRGPAGKDFKLTRLAAYLVAMNGNPNKERVAQAQAYFAVRTREAELAQQPVGDELDAIESLVAAIRVDRQRLTAVEGRQDVAEARLDAIEGNHDWFAAVAYAKLHNLRSESNYLNRVGVRASKILRAQGQEPGRAQHPVWGKVNLYPVDVLAQAFAEIQP
ncbi:hypothetical protein [Nocardiopsis tropica]|uniref:DNA-damage-inducible protein D n=1 Tax=Nocardiopsis tropica TaxID=109330 RepID=A0ABU7KR04_9ACTN|nr:hypothetical protein [Nocardiopsis umidischolae]MEE2051735.1 hypothetical protein [Nocardiopsis umidischolae]